MCVKAYKEGLNMKKPCMEEREEVMMVNKDSDYDNCEDND